jgi:hypothetical protein
MQIGASFQLQSGRVGIPGRDYARHATLNAKLRFKVFSNGLDLGANIFAMS